MVNAVICTSVSLTLKDAVTTEMPREAQPAHHMTAALGTTPHCLSTTLPVGKTQSSRPDVKHVRSTIGLGITAAKRKTPVTFRYSSIPKASISSHQQVPPGRATQRVDGCPVYGTSGLRCSGPLTVMSWRLAHTWLTAGRGCGFPADIVSWLHRTPLWWGRLSTINTCSR